VNYVVSGDITSVFLDRNGTEVVEFIVDTKDLDFIKSLDSNLYCLENGGRQYIMVYYRGSRREYVYLSRLIMGLENEKKMVGFLNDNPLDLRRENLFFVSESGKQLYRKSLNSNNTSGIRGVYWSEKEKRWIAAMKHNGKRYRFGRFKTKEEAARVIEEKRREFLSVEMSSNEGN